MIATLKAQRPIPFVAIVMFSGGPPLAFVAQYFVFVTPSGHWYSHVVFSKTLNFGAGIERERERERGGKG